jgi:hypothetical protein
MSCLLDTSAVNRLCDGVICAEPRPPVYITDLVLLEVTRTPDPDRRRALMAVLGRLLGPGGILRSCCTPSRDFAAEWGADDCYDGEPSPLGRPFPQILRAIGTSHAQHWRDAFIAQAALTYGLNLVTGDKKQARGARRFGVSVNFIGPAPHRPGA